MSEQTKSTEWILTDDDAFQICRTLQMPDGKEVYELYQIESLPSPNFYTISHTITDLDLVCEEEIESVLDCYGYDSKAQLKQVYGDCWRRILAECKFELDAQNGELSPWDIVFPSWESAKDMIERLSGFHPIF